MQANRRRRGNIAIMLLFVIMVCMLGAAMVDYGYVYTVESDMQNAADAAVMAAMSCIGSGDTADARTQAETLAKSFAGHNQVGQGQVLRSSDIQFGHWDGASFTHEGLPINSVRACVRRDGNGSSPVSTFFMNIFGIAELEMSVESIGALSSATAVMGAPVGLRNDSFGQVAPGTTAHFGPSKPPGSRFSVGDQVIVATYGTATTDGLHLIFDVGTSGVGATAGQVGTVLASSGTQVPMAAGDEVQVFDSGKGDTLIALLDDRLDLPISDPARTITAAILEEMPGSRSVGGALSGRVRIVDFVSIRLDGIRADYSTAVPTEHLVGTVVQRYVPDRGIGGHEPSGAGGGTVSHRSIVQ